MMTALVVVALLVAAGITFLLLRPPQARNAPPGKASTAPRREPLLQIALPETGNCCAAAHKIETRRFQKEHAPPLPLADCSMKAGCHCRYQLVPDRRMGDRRTGDDKREAIRFEENPRREQGGRRAKDNLFSNDRD